jgi:hypothetical protein
MRKNTAAREGQNPVPTPEEAVTGSAAALRPVERRVVRWVASGADDAEIARRFGRSTRWVAQVRQLADLDRAATDPVAQAAGGARPADDPLRPLERRLLRWRDQGVGHEELSLRFRRSPAFLARVEQYARYKLASA